MYMCKSLSVINTWASEWRRYVHPIVYSMFSDRSIWPYLRVPYATSIIVYT